MWQLQWKSVWQCRNTIIVSFFFPPFLHSFEAAVIGTRNRQNALNTCAATACDHQGPSAGAGGAPARVALVCRACQGCRAAASTGHALATACGLAFAAATCDTWRRAVLAPGASAGCYGMAASMESVSRSTRARPAVQPRPRPPPVPFANMLSLSCSSSTEQRLFGSQGGGHGPT